MSDFIPFKHPYSISKKYDQKVAYVCMEFGIDQALKIFSGGLGYLAGSHMRSAYQLKQNLVGIGMLWKYGYYDQIRDRDQKMDVLLRERSYNFLKDLGVLFEVEVNHHPVKVKTFLLEPETFGTAPIFLFSTDIPENDHLSRTITHRLYDNNISTKIAQYIVLGQGAYKLMKVLKFNPDVFHLNEAHGLGAAFAAYEDLGSIEAVKDKFVFTTHTPVEAGNEILDLQTLHHMGFFGKLSKDVVHEVSQEGGNSFNMTLAGLRMSRLANGVSAIHGGVAREMWGDYDGIPKITHVTNSQNKLYWADEALDAAAKGRGHKALAARKREMKAAFFQEVADQTGKILDPDVLTIVWARRFAGYKRADLITRDVERFHRLMTDTKRPIQIIWAGKPYPMDYEAIGRFNELVELSKKYPNAAVLTGYELRLSKLMKDGSDIWLNNPRIPREASGTSGMTAAMNGSVNLSTFDGWIPEFAKHGHNAFVVPAASEEWGVEKMDLFDRDNLLNVLEHEILPLYYDDPTGWWKVVKNSMKEVVPFFDSDRMAAEYYTKIYQAAKVLA